MQNSNLYLMTKFSLYFSFTIYYLYTKINCFISGSYLFGTVFTSPFSNLSNIVNLNLAIAVNVIYQCIKGARVL